MGNAMPAAEIEINESLARTLLSEQHPDLAELPLTLIGEGFDNVMFRLGGGLSVRMPRRESAAALVHHEARWLPELAPRLSLPVPVPVRAGAPAHGYPWHWSVLPWFEGDTAATSPLNDPYAAATQLGRFVRELNVAAPAGTTANQYSKGPQAPRFDIVVELMEMLPDEFDRKALLGVWSEVQGAAPYQGPPLWVHGDLHPANLIVNNGEISAVIDFGELSAGDRAVDIAAAIMLLEPGPLQVFRHAADAEDEHLWLRAYGWTILHGVYCVVNSSDNPVINRVGRRALNAVLRDCG